MPSSSSSPNPVSVLYRFHEKPSEASYEINHLPAKKRLCLKSKGSRITIPNVESSEFCLNMSQSDLYAKYLRQKVKSVAQAQQAISYSTILYGPSNAGKTFTSLEMTPSRALDKTDGILKRTLHDLFQMKQQNDTIKLRLIEIDGRNLINLRSGDSLDLIKNGQDGWLPVKKLRTRKEDQVVIEYQQIDEDLPNYSMGMKSLYNHLQKRKTASTHRNNRSSRTHLMVTLSVQARHGPRREMTLVDCAGVYEKFSIDSYTPQQRQEISHINLTLSHLKRCVHELSNQATFINYRNTPLTMLLASSLKPKSAGRVMIIICTDLCIKHKRENVDAMRFGKLVSAIELDESESDSGSPIDEMRQELHEQNLKAVNMLKQSFEKEKVMIKETLQQEVELMKRAHVQERDQWSFKEKEMSKQISILKDELLLEKQKNQELHLTLEEKHRSWSSIQQELEQARKKHHQEKKTLLNQIAKLKRKSIRQPLAGLQNTPSMHIAKRSMNQEKENQPVQQRIFKQSSVQQPLQPFQSPRSQQIKSLQSNLSTLKSSVSGLAQQLNYEKNRVEKLEKTRSNQVAMMDRVVREGILDRYQNEKLTLEKKKVKLMIRNSDQKNLKSSERFHKELDELQRKLQFKEKQIKNLIAQCDWNIRKQHERGEGILSR